MPSGSMAYSWGARVEPISFLPSHPLSKLCVHSGTENNHILSEKRVPVISMSVLVRSEDDEMLLSLPTRCKDVLLVTTELYDIPNVAFDPVVKAITNTPCMDGICDGRPFCPAVFFGIEMY